MPYVNEPTQEEKIRKDFMKRLWAASAALDLEGSSLEEIVEKYGDMMDILDLELLAERVERLHVHAEKSWWDRLWGK